MLLFPIPKCDPRGHSERKRKKQDTHTKNGVAFFPLFVVCLLLFFAGQTFTLRKHTQRLKRERIRISHISCNIRCVFFFRWIRVTIIIEWERCKQSALSSSLTSLSLCVCVWCLFWTQTPDVDKEFISNRLTKSNLWRKRKIKNSGAHNWFRAYFLVSFACARVWADRWQMKSTIDFIVWWSFRYESLPVRFFHLHFG